MVNLGLGLLGLVVVAVGLALTMGLRRTTGINAAVGSPPLQPYPLAPPAASERPKPDLSQRPTITVNPVVVQEFLRQQGGAPRLGVPQAAADAPAQPVTARTPSRPEPAVPPAEPGEQDFFKRLTTTAPPPKGLLRLATPLNQRTPAVPVFATTPKGTLISPEDEAAARSTDEVDAVGARVPSAESLAPEFATVVGRKRRG